MLKLYKKTILWSVLLSVSFLLVAFCINDFTDNSTYAFVQNCLIGIACSLTVVIITTYLQYSSEHETVFYNYKRYLRKLYLKAIYYKHCDINNISASDLRRDIDVLDQYLEELQKYIQNLCWFCPIKNKKYSKSFETIYWIIGNFYFDKYNNPKKALLRLCEESVIRTLARLINESATNDVDRLFVNNMPAEGLKTNGVKNKA